MNLRKIITVLALFIIACFSVTSSALSSQSNSNTPKTETPSTQAQSIRLAVKSLAPFVFEDNGKYTGFSIELWDAISKNLNLETTTVNNNKNVTELIDSVSTNKSDVGIAGVSITAERENKIDFSYPMFRSGLSILTTDSTKSNSIVPPIFGQIGAVIWKYEFLNLVMWMILLSLIPATLLYLSERRKKDGFLDDENFFRGVISAYWWALTGIFGQEDRHPATKTGKAFGLIWMVFGVLFLAFFTAQITANLTSDKLNGTIHSIEDLKDKKVATIKGTTSAKYLKDNSIDYIEYDNLKDAAGSIDNKTTVAVVYDKPALEYFATTNKNNKYTVVGGAFTMEDYGIVLQTNSPIRKKINEELLKMYQNGEYTKIKEKWFGKNDSN
jgi:polar amino acid transport system substrate-binding protein